jgi:YD repeat-containing protein
LLDYQYTYDKTGKIEQKTTQDKTYDYNYDLLQRLTEAKSEDETEGWTYDPNGNHKTDNLNPGDWNYNEMIGCCRVQILSTLMMMREIRLAKRKAG